MSESKPLGKLTWALLAGLPAAAAIGFGAYVLQSRSASIPAAVQHRSNAASRGLAPSGSTGPRIINVTPLPGSNGGPPAAIIVTFDSPIDPLTINTATFKLVRSGGDGTFSNGND